MHEKLLKDPLFRKGLKVRKQVLGAGDIDQRIRDADQYTIGHEEITTKAAWGIIWSRPGLTRKQRSLLNLGILTALHQPYELRHHIQAALRNGLTREEIAEAILHCSVYCGIPRAAEARRAMQQAFAEVDAGLVKTGKPAKRKTPLKKSR